MSFWLERSVFRINMKTNEYKVMETQKILTIIDLGFIFIFFFWYFVLNDMVLEQIVIPTWTPYMLSIFGF